MSDALQKVIKEANKPKGKQRERVKFVLPKSSRLRKRKPRRLFGNQDHRPQWYRSLQSLGRTHTEFHEGEPVRNEFDDTAATSEPPTSTLVLMVSTPPTSSAPDSDFIHMHAPPPSPTTASSPITTTIPITITPLPNFFVGISLP